MQFHSTVIAEPVAQVSGFLSGLAVFGVLHAVGVSPTIEMAGAVGASALVNLVLGAKLNVAMLDLLGLLIVRPASAVAGAEIVHLVVRSLAA